MQEKGCVFLQRVYYSTTILKNFGALRQFSAILFKRGYILSRVARKPACFLPKKLQEKGCIFPKNCKRKGTVLESALAQPRTKIGQVTPRAHRLVEYIRDPLDIMRQIFWTPTLGTRYSCILAQNECAI